MININKSWIIHRNKKNLKRRTRKKRYTKLQRSKQIAYNKSLKTKIPYNKQTHNYKFVAPLKFSFSSNLEETNAFFNKIIQFITDERNFGKSIFIDISNIEELSTDALMYLLAIVNNLNDRFKNKYSFSGNTPTNANINKLFMQSGFYNFVRYQGRKPITTNSDSLKIVCGNNSSTKLAKQVSDFVAAKANTTINSCKFIYIMMVELMSNTHKHAYNEKDILLPQWYCFVEYDKIETISLTFMDTGEGIPATVRKNFTEKIDFLNIKGEDKYVISALEGEFRTSTKQTYRGKGLPKIKEFCSMGKIDYMRIITNKADVKVHNNSYLSNVMKIPLHGTLYHLKININKLRKDENR